MTEPVTTVDAYIAQAPASMEEILRQLRQVIREEAPDVEERLAYGMPSYRLHGNLVHFAAFTRHVSLFGAWPEEARSAAVLQPYASGKGTLQFRPGERLPVEAIREAIRIRVAQQRAAAEESRSF